MQPKSLIEIESSLGNESTALPEEYNAIELVVEKSDGNFEYYLPNPYKEVMFIAREKGFHVSSHDKSYKMQRDFSILFKAIKQIKLLPSFSLSRRQPLGFKYVICSLIMFALIGMFVSKQSDIGIWAAIGLVFGCFLSLAYKRNYRANILFVVNIDGRDENIFFSVHKNELGQCVSYFKVFCGDVFSDGREIK